MSNKVDFDLCVAVAREYGIERYNKEDALGLLEASMMRALFTEVDSDEFDDKLEFAVQSTRQSRLDAYKNGYAKFDSFAEFLNTEKDYIPFAFDMIFEAI